MFSPALDFWGRWDSLVTQIGYGGILLMFIFVVTIIAISLWRGVGLILMLLFLSYAVGAVTYGGLVFIATVIRWGLLILLALCFFKQFVLPKSSMLLIYFYVLLGLIFVSRSPVPMWSFQRGMLLAMTVFTVSISVNSYVDSPKKLSTIFKMGIFSAFVWTASNMIFVKEYIYASQLRFSAGEEIGVVSTAYAGAFFAPMIIWGIVQREYKFWKITSVLLIAPFVFVLFLGGVRTAIVGLLCIGSFPLLFLRGKPVRSILILTMLCMLICVSILLLYVILPDRAEFLIRRLLQASTSGRTDVWGHALQWIVNRAFFMGRGIGAADTAQIELGLLFHNAYLTIWYNTGIFGLLAVLSFLIVYTFRSFRLLMKSSGGELSDYSRTLLGYMLALCAVGMFEGAFAGAGGIAVTMLILVASAIDRLTRLLDQNFPEDMIDYANTSYLGESITY